MTTTTMISTIAIMDNIAAANAYCLLHFLECLAYPSAMLATVASSTYHSVNMRRDGVHCVCCIQRSGCQGYQVEMKSLRDVMMAHAVAVHIDVGCIDVVYGVALVNTGVAGAYGSKDNLNCC